MTTPIPHIEECTQLHNTVKILWYLNTDAMRNPFSSIVTMVTSENYSEYKHTCMTFLSEKKYPLWLAEDDRQKNVDDSTVFLKI